MIRLMASAVGVLLLAAPGHAGAAAPDAPVMRPMQPMGQDASRSLTLLHSQVQARHADLFRPRDAEQQYQLTVLLNAEGGIDKEKVEPLPPGGAPVFATSLGLEKFMELGMKAEDIGLMGTVSVTMTPERPAPPTVDAEGIARGMSMPVFRVLTVRYAWPRRPGEPIGGSRSLPAALSGAPTPPPSLPPGIERRGQLARQYFPEGSPPNGNWILLDSDGEVLRTGHVDIGPNDNLTSTYMERLIPGLEISESSTMGMTSPLRGPIAPFNGTAGVPVIRMELTRVTFFVLAPGSPRPPAEGK